MKKLIALMLTFIMVCSLSVSAWAIPKKIGTETAAETEETAYNWDDIKDAVEADDGRFYTFDEIALKIWIPEDLEECELTDEDREAGFIAYFADDDEEEVISAVLADVGVESLEDWMSELKDEYGITDCDTVTVNGYDAVIYSDEEEDCFCLDFVTESGKLLEFTFFPYSDDDFFEDAVISIYSIMPEE